MANTTTAHSTSIILADDQGNPPTEIRLRAGGELFPGWCAVELLRGGAVVAMPIRFKMTDSGGRVAADFPGCSGTYVITDSEGHITNG